MRLGDDAVRIDFKNRPDFPLDRTLDDGVKKNPSGSYRDREPLTSPRADDDVFTVKMAGGAQRHTPSSVADIRFLGSLFNSAKKIT